MIEIRNKEEFDELVQSHSLVLVDFWAEWCSSCKNLLKTIGNLSESLEGQCIVSKVNIEDVPELADEMKIRSLPTVCVFKNGELKQKLVGNLPENRYKEVIKDL